jgi:hypothetical protein
MLGAPLSILSLLLLDAVSSRGSVPPDPGAAVIGQQACQILRANFCVSSLPFPFVARLLRWQLDQI